MLCQGLERWDTRFLPKPVISTYKDYHKRYYENHKTKISQKMSLYKKSHRKRLNQLNRIYQSRSRDLMNKLKHKPCVDCQGWFEPCQMEFDHRPGEEKLFEIGNRYSSSLRTLTREMSKCDLVCSNCHRLRTWKRTQ